MNKKKQRDPYRHCTAVAIRVLNFSRSGIGGGLFLEVVRLRNRYKNDLKVQK